MIPFYSVFFKSIFSGSGNLGYLKRKAWSNSSLKHITFMLLTQEPTWSNHLLYFKLIKFILDIHIFWSNVSSKERQDKMFYSLLSKGSAQKF